MANRETLPNSRPGPARDVESRNQELAPSNNYGWKLSAHNCGNLAQRRTGAYTPPPQITPGQLLMAWRRRDRISPANIAAHGGGSHGDALNTFLGWI
jgi:hypothetical protein